MVKMQSSKTCSETFNRWFRLTYIGPTKIRLWILIGSVIVLGSGLVASGSRKFLTGLIIGTLLARNGQYGGQTSYQPSYSYQPPPSYPSGGHSNSNQPLLIIIPTSSSGKGSSYKAQPTYSHPPPPPPAATYKSEPAQYAPAAEHAHSSYSDRASARRRVSSQMRSSGSLAATAPTKLINKIILEPSNRIRNHLGLPFVPYGQQSSQLESAASTSEPVSTKGYNLLEPQEIFVSRRRSGRASLERHNYSLGNKSVNQLRYNNSGQKPYDYSPFMEHNRR